MLLRIGGGIRHLQFDLAGLQVGDFDAQRRHRGLACEAGPDPSLEVCIFRIESRHPGSRLLPYLPFHFGVRLLRKASIPSRKSSLI